MRPCRKKRPRWKSTPQEKRRETSQDTMSEVKLEFPSREQAINYAKKNKINHYVVDPQKRKIIKKSYADNFLKDK